MLANWKTKAKALKSEVYALYLCSKHPKTPLYAKFFALLIVGYALSPMDLIPDFVPILGYVDDLVLIPMAISLLIKMMPKHVLEECKEIARQASPASKPRQLTGAIIVVCLWVLAIYLALRLVLPIVRT